MKRAFTILFFFVLSHLSMAKENSKLPEEPWKAIVEMTKYQTNSRWEDNISVKLMGNYSQQDSLMVESAIKMLNELTGTIKLQMTSDDWGNLEIFFIDSTNRLIYQNLFNIQAKDTDGYSITSKYSTPDHPGLIAHFELAFQLPMVPDSARQYFITNQLAFSLFPVRWFNNEGFNNGIYKGPVSIFLSYTTEGMSPYYSDLISFDREIIKAIYNSNFEELLPMAKMQFGKFQLPRWVDHNSVAILVFPFILILFLLVGAFVLLYKKLFARIKNKVLQFNVIAILALLSIATLMSFTSMASFLLIEPYTFSFNSKSLSLSLLISIIVGLPAVNIFRLIEIAINRKAQHKFLNTLLLFLSTSLIPSGILLAIIYSTTKERINSDVINTMIFIFLGFVFIGILRALISFFILKEKELRIENEVKLASLRELKTKAELNALHSRVNPHFLYNALNSITGLAKIDAEKTEHMALSLSKLFRYSINKEQSDWSTLYEELEMVKIYLDIEKVRFEDRLDFRVDLPDELGAVKIPRFIIQPLVENAIKHGISKLVTN
jgi:sensor histidine kinase YesM